MSKSSRTERPLTVIGSVSTLTLLASVAAAGCTMDTTPADESTNQQNQALITDNFTNGSGRHNTVGQPESATSNEFFKSLGTNGRACVNCHQPAAAWGITPPQIQAVFNATNGTDPLFRTNDGSNAPNLPVATVAQRRTAYSMLLNRGLIRVGLPIPANAEFDLALVEDPYHFASATELSLFRRPLPTTNLKFLSTVMWDGRESVAGNTLNQNLARQSNDATLGHAQATVPGLSAAQQQSIVNFELGLFTAQNFDNAAGDLTAAGAQGGPTNLSQQNFFIGINDPLGGNPTGAAFNPSAFTLFDAWAGLAGNAQNNARASIARGQKLFNTKPIAISGVRGLNDTTGIATINGFCTTCHDSPNVGDHSVALPLDIGLTVPEITQNVEFPRYTLRNKTTGATIRTSDPGRAMITGKWADISRFKGPILRGLASRAPYFHNGTSATLADVVKFYDTRFHIGFQAQELLDLQAFLESL